MNQEVDVSKEKRPNNPVSGKLSLLRVLEAGIEPARPKSLDFESSASTNSATRANMDGKNNKLL